MSDLIEPSIFHKKVVIARKDHRCCECGGYIGRGFTYENISGIWDNKWANFKTCIPCAYIREQKRRLHGEGSAFGSLYDWLHELNR